MKSLHNFLVTPKEERYNNKSDSGIILNTKLDDHNFVSRKAIVVETPIITDTNIQKGDELIIHHNVFRRFINIRGEEVNSSSYFKDNMFFATPDQVFMYKQNNNWIGAEGYCFVKPIKSTNKFDLDTERPLIGILKYSDLGLKKLGINTGDLIGFTPHSEYEFIIDKERLYRVPTNSISILYEYQGDEEEYNPSWAESSR